MRSVLVIAGSDSGGGAGIQADLQALAGTGVHGCTAVTCVTAQNTRGVTVTHPLPSDVIRAQIRAVLDDIPVQAVKTGMLYSPEIVEAVTEEVEGLPVPMVVDPVMVATAGSSLSTSDFAESLDRRLVPKAALLTPNLDEARVLTGGRVEDVEGMEAAARSLVDRGAGAVLVKGGHLEGELVDVLFDGEEIHTFRGPRYPVALHGSGCALASSIAGHLARERGLVESVRRARRYVAAGFATQYAVGQGVPLINAAYREDRWAIYQEVLEAVGTFVGMLPPHWVPEVGINLGYALPGAQGLEDVCAVAGRIVRVGDEVRAVGPPGFGVSRHVARIILAAMASDPAMRSAVNLRHSGSLVDACRTVGLTVSSFDRSEEPVGVHTMDWGTRQAIRQAGEVPDAIADGGGPGKVAMVRILGQDPGEVVDKVRRVVEA